MEPKWSWRIGKAKVVGWWVGGRETRREFVVGGMVKDSKGQAFELKICSKQLTPKVS